MTTKENKNMTCLNDFPYFCYALLQIKECRENNNINLEVHNNIYLNKVMNAIYSTIY